MNPKSRPDGGYLVGTSADAKVPTKYPPSVSEIGGPNSKYRSNLSAQMNPKSRPDGGYLVGTSADAKVPTKYPPSVSEIGGPNGKCKGQFDDHVKHLTVLLV